MLKFLLHTCCAPCSVAIIDELKNQFALTVFFYNPNIHPKEEYEKRKIVIQKICSEMKILFVEGEYEADKWFETVRGYENEPEGGARCPICFKMRLEKTAQYASKNGFEYFGSTLTSGRNKKAEIINPLGRKIGEKYGVKFYEEDWKKKGRQERSRELCQKKDIYRQSYCGCKYSLGGKGE